MSELKAFRISEKAVAAFIIQLYYIFPDSGLKLNIVPLDFDMWMI